MGEEEGGRQKKFSGCFHRKKLTFNHKDFIIIQRLIWLVQFKSMKVSGTF
jgi:hypothetical protein